MFFIKNEFTKKLFSIIRMIFLIFLIITSYSPLMAQDTDSSGLNKPDGGIDGQNKDGGPQFPPVNTPTMHPSAPPGQFNVHEHRNKLNSEVNDAIKKWNEGGRQGGPEAINEQIEGIKKKYSDPAKTRSQELKNIGSDLADVSGSDPKITSDYDGTLKNKSDMEKIIKNAQSKGYHIEKGKYRVNIPELDATFWVPPPEKGTPEYGDYVKELAKDPDAFPTEGGKHSASGGKAGVPDPEGSVLANKHKAAAAANKPNMTPEDFHTVGKSLDKAIKEAKGCDKTFKTDPKTSGQAERLRNGEHPDVVFRNDAEKKEFLEKTKDIMSDAEKTAAKKSKETMQDNQKKLNQLEKEYKNTGDPKTKEKLDNLKKDMDAVRKSNEACRDGIKVNEKKGENNKLNNEKKDLESKNKDIKEKQDINKEQQKKANQEEKNITKEQKKLSDENKKIQKERDNLKNEKTKAGNDPEKQKQIDKRDQELKNKQKDINQKQQELNNKKSDVKKTQDKLKETGDKLKGEQNKVKNQQNEVQKKIKNNNKEITKITGEPPVEPGGPGKSGAQGEKPGISKQSPGSKTTEGIINEGKPKNVIEKILIKNPNITKILSGTGVGLGTLQIGSVYIGAAKEEIEKAIKEGREPDLTKVLIKGTIDNAIGIGPFIIVAQIPVAGPFIAGGAMIILAGHEIYKNGLVDGLGNLTGIKAIADYLNMDVDHLIMIKEQMDHLHNLAEKTAKRQLEELSKLKAKLKYDPNNKKKQEEYINLLKNMIKCKNMLSKTGGGYKGIYEELLEDALKKEGINFEDIKHGDPTFIQTDREDESGD